MEESAAEAWAPLVSAPDQLAHELSASERESVTRFVERVADAPAQHAD